MRNQPIQMSPEFLPEGLPSLPPSNVVIRPDPLTRYGRPPPSPPQIGGIWCAKDMESLDRPERRELIKTGREALARDGRLKVATLCAKAIAEVRGCVRTEPEGGWAVGSQQVFPLSRSFRRLPSLSLVLPAFVLERLCSPLRGD